jgi:hypothetical protein
MIWDLFSRIFTWKITKNFEIMNIIYLKINTNFTKYLFKSWLSKVLYQFARYVCVQTSGVINYVVYWSAFLFLKTFITCRSFPHSWSINWFVTILTRRVPIVEQELFTLLGHLSSAPVCSGVRVTRSLVLCVCFVDRSLSFFLWPLCCLFFDLRILITPFASSNSS